MHEGPVASLSLTNINAKTIHKSHFQPIDWHFFQNNQVDKMSQKSNKKEDSDKKSGDNKKVPPARPPAPVPAPKKEAPAPARPPPPTEAPSKEAPAPLPSKKSSTPAPTYLK